MPPETSNVARPEIVLLLRPVFGRVVVVPGTVVRCTVLVVTVDSSTVGTVVRAGSVVVVEATVVEVGTSLVACTGVVVVVSIIVVVVSIGVHAAGRDTVMVRLTGSVLAMLRPTVTVKDGKLTGKFVAVPSMFPFANEPRIVPTVMFEIITPFETLTEETVASVGKSLFNPTMPAQVELAVHQLFDHTCSELA